MHACTDRHTHTCTSATGAANLLHVQAHQHASLDGSMIHSNGQVRGHRVEPRVRRWVVLAATPSAYKSSEPHTGPHRSHTKLQLCANTKLARLTNTATPGGGGGGGGSSGGGSSSRVRTMQTGDAGRDLRLRLAALKGETCRSWEMNATLTNTRGRQSRSVGNKDTKACFCH